MANKRSERETDKRRDALLKRMLDTPPQPHKRRVKIAPPKRPKPKKDGD